MTYPALAAIVLSYVLLCFICSALYVRGWPRSWIGRAIRKQLVLTMLFPLLALTGFGRALLQFLPDRIPWLAHIFEAMSGQRLYRRDKGTEPYRSRPVTGLSTTR